jgi:pseudouridylate synthase / pseudouridine kinase
MVLNGSASLQVHQLTPQIGFPYPDNLSLASRLESTVRIHGGIPATIGVIDGIARVGMEGEELARLAASSEKDTTLKLSRRDLGIICGMVRHRIARGGGNI